MFSTSLILWLALFSSVSHAASPLAPAPLFLDHPDFTFCDAQLLAELWGVDVDEAKQRAQQKLSDFGLDSVEGVLLRGRDEQLARSETLCDLPMHNIRSAEAAALAVFWGISEEEAKARASQKLFHGDEWVLYSELEAAQGVEAPMPLDDDGAWEKWHQAGFRYCDAKILANAWGGDPWDAKVRGGHKIAAAGSDSGLRDALMSAAGPATEAGVSCTYVDGDVSYDDAVLLAQLWGLQDADDAKTRVEQKLGMGLGPEVQDTLSAVIRDLQYGEMEGGEGSDAHAPFDPQPDVDAFLAAEREYSFCDAQVLAQSWSVSEYEAKAAIGYKLRRDFAHQLPSLLEGARRGLVDAGAVDRCSAEQSGLVDDDLASLAAHWEVSADESRLRAEQMLFYGQWTALQAELEASRQVKKKKKRRRWFRRHK